MLSISRQALQFRFTLTGIIKPITIDDTPNFSRTDIEVMASHLKHHTSIEQAVKLLNCNRTRLYFLINSLNFIPSQVLIYSNGTIQPLYSSNDIHNLGYHIK